MTIYGGIDPGLVACGYAWVDDVGGKVEQLTKAGIVRGDPKFDFSNRIMAIADALLEFMPLCDVLYVESMRYRPHAKVNPAILLQLNLLAGTCARLVAPGGVLMFVEPQTWKGQLEKDVHHSRIRVTLNEDERRIVEDIRPKSLAHNALDAVGLCLYATGRLTPKTRTITK